MQTVSRSASRSSAPRSGGSLPTSLATPLSTPLPTSLATPLPTPLATPPSRVCQPMLSGRRLHIMKPAAREVDIEDIARGLSRLPRWNGQTKGSLAFSVAQHSLLVRFLFAELDPKAEKCWQLAALLHDGPEYALGDLIAPFKKVVGETYHQVEQSLQQAIHRRFSLPKVLPSSVAARVEKADRWSASLEAQVLTSFPKETIAQLSPLSSRPFPGAAHALLEPWPSHVAQGRFLQEFARLYEEKGASLG